MKGWIYSVDGLEYLYGSWIVLSVIRLTGRGDVHVCGYIRGSWLELSPFLRDLSRSPDDTRDFWRHRTVNIGRKVRNSSSAVPMLLCSLADFLPFPPLPLRPPSVWLRSPKPDALPNGAVRSEK